MWRRWGMKGNMLIIIIIIIIILILIIMITIAIISIMVGYAKKWGMDRGHASWSSSPRVKTATNTPAVFRFFPPSSKSSSWTYYLSSTQLYLDCSQPPRDPNELLSLKLFLPFSTFWVFPTTVCCSHLSSSSHFADGSSVFSFSISFPFKNGVLLLWILRYCFIIDILIKLNPRELGKN